MVRIKLGGEVETKEIKQLQDRHARLVKIGKKLIDVWLDEIGKLRPDYEKGIKRIFFAIQRLHRVLEDEK